MLLNFFVRTAILLNRLRCTATWLPYKQTKKRRADEADLKAVPSPSRRSDPDLDITEIGDICSGDGTMEAEGV